MPTAAAYDAHADWYERYVTGEALRVTRRAQDLLRELLGAGAGRCLEVCCGTGIHAPVVQELGWAAVGVDISGGQLRYATRRLPVALADATALPVAGRSLPAVVCLMAHTDVTDYPGVLREVARVLRPGGRFVHIGVHPCFVGAFADRSDRPRVVVDPRYGERSRSFDGWCPTGVRARLGARHLPLPDLLNAVTAAGLSIRRTAEAGPPGGVPDLFGLAAAGTG
jgi:ubiquinone/menaquinone biosynthesis C-methylase UbiE